MKKIRSSSMVSDFKEIFLNNKIECVVCLVGFVFSCVIFKYSDSISLEAWALETMDAFLRGGFSGFDEIMTQNLWSAPHGVCTDVMALSNLLYSVWCFPVLVIHYIFNTSYVINQAVLVWGKFFYVLVTIATGYASYKTVCVISGKKEGAMLTAILIWGSASIMTCVGYAGQDEMLYIFFMIMGIYYAVNHKKIRSLLSLSLSCIVCPLMLILTIPVILYSSKSFLETIFRFFVVLVATLAEIACLSFSSSGFDSDSQIKSIFKRGIDTGYAGASLVAIIVLTVFLFQWLIKRDENEKKKYLVWSMALISCAICVLGTHSFYRFSICIPFMALSIGTVESSTERAGGIASLAVFESCRIWIYAQRSNFLRLYAFPYVIRKCFGIENLTRGTSGETILGVLNSFYPNLGDYNIIFCGFLIAGAICFFYICSLSRKKGLFCNINEKVLSVGWCSIQIVIVLLALVFLYRVNVINIGDPADNASLPINGENVVEEYYCGKNARKLLISVVPSTTGKGYPDTQELVLDIVDADSNVTIASASFNAANIKSHKLISFLIDDVDIKEGKWYIFRFYSPKTIDNPDHYMYILGSRNGTAQLDRHYAINNTDGVDTVADYDYVYQIISL